jgi:hypothetical protein
MKKKVLATSWHTGGINAIIPVVKRISEEGRVDIVTIGHLNSENVLKDRGVSFKTVSDYGLSDVSVDSMERILDIEQPNLVLTGTSAQDAVNGDVVEQTVTLAANTRDIQSLAVLDYWANYSLRFNDIYTREKHRFLPDKIAIMDDLALQDMVAEGFNRDNLAITGNPHFDDLEGKARNFPDSEKRAIRDRLGFSGDFPFLFYAGGAFLEVKAQYGYWDQDILEIIVNSLSELPEKRQPYVALSLHPGVLDPAQKREDLPRLAEYINGIRYEKIKLVLGKEPWIKIDSQKYFVDPDLKSQKLAIVSDLTMTASSTLGIEAVYMGKPCVSLQPNLSSEVDPLVISRNGIIPVGYTPEFCRGIVLSAANPDDYNHIIERAACFRTDGKATERVTNLVYDMLKE